MICMSMCVSFCVFYSYRVETWLKTSALSIFVPFVNNTNDSNSHDNSNIHNNKYTNYTGTDTSTYQSI